MSAESKRKWRESAANRKRENEQRKREDGRRGTPERRLAESMRDTLRYSTRKAKEQE